MDLSPEHLDTEPCDIAQTPTVLPFDLAAPPAQWEAWEEGLSMKNVQERMKVQASCILSGVLSSTPREPLPLNSSLGIAIPIFARPVKASGGSGEGGRGIGGENLAATHRQEGDRNNGQESKGGKGCG